MIRRTSVMLAVLMLAFSVAMAMAQATNPGPPSAEPGSSAGPNGTMNDTAAMQQPSRAVRGEIQNELRKNNLNGVTTKVTKDSIILGGTVATKAEHDNAVEIARSVGQKNREIVDHITVSETAR